MAADGADTLEQPAVTAEATDLDLASGDTTTTRPRKRPLGRKGAAGVGLAAAAASAASASGTGAAAAGPTTAGAPGVPDAEADEATRVISLEDQTPDWLNATTVVSPVATRPDLERGLLAGDDHEVDDEHSPSQGAAVGAAAGAGAAVAGALGSVGERVGSLAKRAVDKVSELSPDTAPRADQGDLEAPAPLVPAEPLTKDESKLALAIVVGFVVLALVIGIYGVSRIGSRNGSPSDGAAPATRTTTVAPSSAAPSGSASATTAPQTAGAPEPLAILKVEAYDPEGDGAENNNLTPKVYDGDKSTGWFSENYRSDTFGGLKKGVGVIVDLGPNKKPQTVELDLPHPSDVEVYVGPDNRLEGATKVGDKTDADGTVTFDVPADVSGQYIVVWFTKLNADDNGKRRAWLDEVVVTG